MERGDPKHSPFAGRIVPVLVVAAVTAAVAAGVWVLRRPAGPPGLTSPTEAVRIEKPSPRPDGYVGSGACAECHADISRRYAGHPMGRSLARVLAAGPVEDYDHATFASGNRSYRVERTAEGVRHYESMTGIDGEPIYDQSVEVAYALGSGRRGRGYVIDRGGLLFLSPISWYSGRDRWDLSPGYGPDSHPRFERRATGACLGCHSGRLNVESGGADRYGDPPFLEEAVGCERCHGPGKGHVERHRSGNLALADPIVNPADLEPARREAVCQQCHLQGEERLPRYGRSEQDFRPGDRLEDVWTVFVGGTGLSADGTTQAVSHVEQMRASRCFTASDGRLGCVSCHDPHGLPAPEERAEFFDGRCLTCHAGSRGPREQTDALGPACGLSQAEQERPPAAGSCVHCHMPRLAANDVPHTSQSDHRILRRPRAGGSADGPVTSDRPPELFDGAGDRLPPVEVARAEGLRLILSANETGDSEVAREAESRLRESLAAAADDADVLEALGDAADVLGRPEEAVRYWKRAADIAPDRETALTRLADTYQREGQFREALDVLDRLIVVNPWAAESHGRRAFVLVRLGRLEDAAQAAGRALELNPSIRQTYRSMAELHRLLGDEARSERYSRLFSRFPPE